MLSEAGASEGQARRSRSILPAPQSFIAACR
jgi:hypothetical protein